MNGFGGKVKSNRRRLRLITLRDAVLFGTCHDWKTLRDRFLDGPGSILEANPKRV
jgi:hypothetical protein